MIFTPKHTNSHLFDTNQKILTPALLVVLVTNMRYGPHSNVFVFLLFTLLLQCFLAVLLIDCKATGGK